MAPIEVVSLVPENVPTADAEEKVDAVSEASGPPEKEVETSRKRGRPAGAKDAKRRKTPVRRKKVEEASSTSPVIQEEPITPEVASHPPSAPPPPQVPPPPTIAPRVAPIVPTVEIPREPERPLYHHRLDYPEQMSALQNHWDSLIVPMFHHHRRRMY